MRPPSCSLFSALSPSPFFSFFRHRLGAVVTLALLGGCDGCQRSPAPPAPPQGGSSVPGSPAPLEASGPAKEAALVRDHRLGIDDLRKEIAEKKAVERRRERPAVPERAADVLLQGRVTTRLWDDPSVPAGAIAVSVKDGHVTLEGRVGSVEQVQRALIDALMTAEVAGVTSELTVEPDDGKGSTHDAPGAPPK